MVERLRHREMHPNLIQLQCMKEILCKKRIEVAKHMKSEAWTLNNLEIVLKSLKKGKCRDPQGFINDIVKPDVIGADLKNSLLVMLNKTKDTLTIPEMMKTVNVAMLPKPGKPGLHEVENQRGVFLISVFRSILMKLLLKDEYETLDKNITDSNIGGRKKQKDPGPSVHC